MGGARDRSHYRFELIGEFRMLIKYMVPCPSVQRHGSAARRLDTDNDLLVFPHSATVLNKPDRLSDEEFEVVKRHVESGARLVSVPGDDELTEMISHHHERLDGGGYPSGLAGPEIPVGARIIAVADTFDAITSTRAYRDSRSHRQAMDVLLAEAGSQLDPNAVAAFNRRYADFQPIAIWGLATQLVPRGVQALLGGAQSAAGSLASVAGRGGGRRARRRHRGGDERRRAPGSRRRPPISRPAPPLPPVVAALQPGGPQRLIRSFCKASQAATACSVSPMSLPVSSA